MKDFEAIKILNKSSIFNILLAFIIIVVLIFLLKSFFKSKLEQTYTGLQYGNTVLVVDKKLNESYAENRSWVIVLLGLEVLFTSFLSLSGPDNNVVYIAFVIEVVNEFLLYRIIKLQFSVKNRNFLLIAAIQQIEQDEREKYIESVMEYRERINTIVTSAVIILTTLIVYYSLVIAKLNYLIDKKLSIALGVVTFSLVGSGLFFILRTESKLERIYWRFFPKQYEYLIKDSIGL